MILGYIDESYDAEQYWLTAVMVPAADALALQRDLDAVVASAGKYGVAETAELHGHPLQHAKDDWAPMGKAVRARIKIYSDALDAISSYQGIEIAFRGIDIEKQAALHSSSRSRTKSIQRTHCASLTTTFSMEAH